MTHETIIDGVSIAPGATETGVVPIDRSDRDIRFFVVGDANSGALDIDFYSKAAPDNGGVWFLVEGSERKGVDLTTAQHKDNAEVFKPDIRPSGDVQISITNNGASSTTITVYAKRYVIS